MENNNLPTNKERDMKQAVVEKLKILFDELEVGQYPIELHHGKKVVITVYSDNDKILATDEEIAEFEAGRDIRNAIAQQIIEDDELPDESDMYSLSDGKPLI